MGFFIKNSFNEKNLNAKDTNVNNSQEESRKKSLKQKDTKVNNTLPPLINENGFYLVPLCPESLKSIQAEYTKDEKCIPNWNELTPEKKQAILQRIIKFEEDCKEAYKLSWYRAKPDADGYMLCWFCTSATILSAIVSSSVLLAAAIPPFLVFSTILVAVLAIVYGLSCLNAASYKEIYHQRITLCDELNGELEKVQEQLKLKQETKHQIPSPLKSQVSANLAVNTNGFFRPAENSAKNENFSAENVEERNLRLKV